jgi:uncharacterized protein
MLSTTTIATRVEDLDWSRIGRDLDERGYAITPRVLSEDECDELKGLFGEENRFRTTVDMRRVRFGSGVYRYFDNPLPEAVQGLREAFYPPLSRVANDWAEKLGAKEEFPSTLEGFRSAATRRGRLGRRL